jgi:hypothetical protein
MMMRYHWGLGVGHIYSHQRHPQDGNSTTAASPSNVRDLDLVGNDELDANDVMDDEEPLVSEEPMDVDENSAAAPADDDDVEHNPDEWMGSEDSDFAADDNRYNDEELLELDGMYGDSYDVELYD